MRWHVFKKAAFVAISLGIQNGETVNAMIVKNVPDACFHVSMLIVSSVLVLLMLKEEVERVD